MYWYDNRDPIFEVFSYDAFITVINNGLTALYNQIGDPTLIPPFFSYDNYYHKIFYYKNINDTNTVYYSKNLFPYVGEAFNINMYFVRPVGIDSDVYSINIEQDPRLQEIVTFNSIQYNKVFKNIMQ